MATIPTQALRHLQLETTLGTDVFIPMQVQYSEALGQPFQVQLTLACHATDVDFDNILGTNATIAIHNAATARKGAFGYTRYINGFFSSIGFHGHGAEGEALFQATVVPWLWFLTRTSDCRIFQNKTVPEILEEIFRDAGFSDFRKDLHGEYKPREFCVQFRETDFQFVMRLMECEGIYYYFEHDNGSHMMVLCDDMVCHKNDDQHEVIRYIGGAEAMDRKGCINEWSFSKQVKPGRVALNDFNFKTPVPDPNLRLLARSTAPETQKPDTYEIYDSFGGYGDVSEGNRYARIRMEQAIADRETAHGSTDIVGLRAGGKFTLDRHPIESQNREYLLTRVEFMAREATYGSGSGGGGQFFTSSFTCIPMEVTFRPLRTTPLPRIEGPQTATVCGPKGEEIYVDESARVKVQFHWDRYGKADAGSSCWIRVSQPWAGAGFGGMAIPRIGHEVIVEFIEGDPDRPIITGRVYNEAHKSPYALPEHATKTTIKSNSSPGSQGFNELRFEDKKGKEQVFIHSQKNFDLRVKNQIRETNIGERHEKIGQSHYVTVEKDANTHIVEKNYEMTKESHLTVQGDLLENVDGSIKTYVLDSNIINAKDLRVDTSDSISLKTNICKIQGAMSVHVRGQQINVEGTSLCLKSGSSFISITPAGIFIQAPMVMLNSGGSASPAQDPAARPDFKVEQPLDAYAAAVANPGKMVGVGGGTTKTRTRGSGPVKLHDAPDYTPPPDSPLPIVDKPPLPPKDEILVCGGPYKLKDKEGRLAQGLNIEVVPKSLMGGDVVTVTSAKGCSCAGAKVMVGSVSTGLGTPSKIDGWVISDEPFTLMRILGDASPKIVPVSLICGRDNSSLSSGEVKVYPSDIVAIKVELAELSKKCPAVDSLLRGIANILSHLTQMPIDPYKGFKFNQGLGQVKIGEPKLSLSYESRWKEYPVGHLNEWQAYYAWKVGVGAAVSWEYKLDLITVGVAATGVGAGIVVMYNRIKDALGQKDPLIFISLKFELALNSSCGYEEKAFGALEGKGTGTLGIGAGINTDVVEAKCDASTGVSGRVIGVVSKTGLKVSVELLKWTGVTGKASVKLKIGKLINIGYERSVVLIEEAGPLIKGSIGS